MQKTYAVFSCVGFLFIKGIIEYYALIKYTVEVLR